MSYYTAKFWVGFHRFRVPFPKLQTFSEIFWALHIDYSQYEKTILGIFAYLFIYEDKTRTVFRNSAAKPQHVLFENEPFYRKMLVSYFSSNIPLYIGRNPVEKLYKLLEIEIKTYTPVGLKFVFEKIELKVLHFVQHDFIRQRPGLSKDQINMFKTLVINYSILKYRHTF